MKLYRHLAWDGIRKNSRLYVPYLLTGVGAVSFFYILVALSRLPEGTLPGSGSVQVILNLGSFVLWVFSLLLLFYTHSFLIRRRNREFALYNVLGMGKRDIARILCWETLLSGGISLAGGLALGILLGKLAELGLLRMVGAATDMVYRVSAGGLLLTLGLYGAIYLLILISSLLRVGRSTAVQLMRSQAEGEKPPRANWALAVLGILLLVLRLLYLQKRESLAASADQVLVTVEEVQTELQKMNLPRRLDQRTLEELMRTLRRYNLARPVGRLTGLDSRIEVFPTVLLALPDADLADAAAESSRTREELALYERPDGDASGEEEE